VKEFYNQLDIVGETVDALVEKGKKLVSDLDIDMKQLITDIIGTI